jgi:methionyl-tRNA formyltransferase
VLINSKHKVVGVFTQSDKKRGRSQEICFSEVKKCALKNGIDIFQPKTLKDGNALKVLEIYKPDLIVVVAYGKILPKEVLNFPKFGCINIHGSLLPQYRGAAPIQWSVINGETVTGVTSMYMDEGLDTGDIILTRETEILKNETSGELFDRLKTISKDLLLETINLIENGSAKRIKQDESQMSLAPMLSKEISKIDFRKSADEVHNLIRGLNPWPVAMTKLCGKNLKIYSSLRSDINSKIPGEIISLNPLVIACGKGSIEVKEVQLEGKKRMKACDFVLGSKLKAGDILG